MPSTILTCPNCQTFIHYKRCHNCSEWNRHYIKHDDYYMGLDVGHCSHKRAITTNGEEYCKNWNGK